MRKKRKSKKRFVIVCAGASGSGKTRLALRLTNLLGNAVCLFYDHYSHLQEWPDDYDAWLASGADPTKTSIPTMKTDLEALLAGETIINPVTNRKVRPKKYIIIEDPFGRCRPDIGPLIDYVILLDIPLEVSLTWAILRCFKGDFLREDGTIVPQEEVDVREKLALIEKFISGEYYNRDLYLALNGHVRQQADCIVTDLKPTDEIAKKVLLDIKKLQK